MDILLYLAILALVLIVLVQARGPRYGRPEGPFQVTIVHDFEWALAYEKGRFTELLPPGRYWAHPWRRTIYRFDMRQAWLVVPGQEILTKDTLGLKISLLIRYSIDDPRALTKGLAVTTPSEVERMLHQASQVPLRELVSGLSLDEVLADRGALGSALLERLKTLHAEHGVTIHAVEPRDFMLGRELRAAYAAVPLAQKDAEAQMERARGQTASLRALSNAARLVKDNPDILKLRLLDTLADPAGAKNTVMIDFSGLEGRVAAPEGAEDAGKKPAPRRSRAKAAAKKSPPTAD
ncbi:MAG: slipin family protein [Pseudomonadota bacterium]